MSAIYFQKSLSHYTSGTTARAFAADSARAFLSLAFAADSARAFLSLAFAAGSCFYRTDAFQFYIVSVSDTLCLSFYLNII